MLPFVHKSAGGTPRFDHEPTTGPNSLPPKQRKPNGRRGEEEERSEIKGEVCPRVEEHPKTKFEVNRLQTASIGPYMTDLTGAT